MSSGGKAGLNSSPPAGRATSSSTAPRSRVGADAKSSNAVGRTASKARRQAMSSRGKAGLSTTERVRTAAEQSEQATTAPQPETEQKAGCSCGCKNKEATGDVTSTSPATTSTPRTRPMPRNTAALSNSGRALSRARRQALSSRGKAGLSANGMSAAQTARAANPNLSGRELAQTLRAQRSRNGKAGQKKTAPAGRVRPAKPTAGAEDAPWKVGVSETGHGQRVTGTMVGRSTRMTGDEPSTCRAITGTEYLGADIFRSFCQTEPSKAPRRVGVSPTGRGNRVTGNEVGRSKKVTGDEPGTCKRVTGTEYVGASQQEAFCASKPEPTPAKVSRSETRKGKAITGTNVGRSSKVTGDEPGADRELTGTQYMTRGNGTAPVKVGASSTLRGGTVTGTIVGRSARVTGDEPGSCRSVTGDDYIGQEQYQGFCSTTPQPQDAKVGISQTLQGKTVTGTMTGRSSRVTGDEPGTCKAVTGTPYAGAEQYQTECTPEDTVLAAARTRRQRATPGSVMTGQQPGINGKLTGSEKGACEPVTGTPYVGADQFAAACPATPAEPGSSDFPQSLDGTPWGQFSVTPPAHAAQEGAGQSAVTGSRYEEGNITGPFGMGTGKVTGTEEFRFGRGGAAAPATPAPAELVDGRVKSRITGEGMDAGPKITGDDWDRGDRVTGTEGTSAMRRNPTRRGGAMSTMAAMQAAAKRNEELPEPVSKVTGGSGNTERGALITYSGGARG